jgi:hypothetical protein
VDVVPDKSVQRGKNKNEIDTIREGEKWVSIVDSNHTVISLVEGEI